MSASLAKSFGRGEGTTRTRDMRGRALIARQHRDHFAVPIQGPGFRLLGASLLNQLFDLSDTIEAKRLRHIEELENVQSSFAQFVARDELLWLAQAPGDVSLVEACIPARANQHGEHLPISHVRNSLPHGRRLVLLGGVGRALNINTPK